MKNKNASLMYRTIAPPSMSRWLVSKWPRTIAYGMLSVYTTVLFCVLLTVVDRSKVNVDAFSHNRHVGVHKLPRRSHLDSWSTELSMKTKLNLYSAKRVFARPQDMGNGGGSERGNANLSSSNEGSKTWNNSEVRPRANYYYFMPGRSFLNRSVRLYDGSSGDKDSVGEGEDAKDGDEKSERVVRPDFGDLFKGMPSLGEIVAPLDKAGDGDGDGDSDTVGTADTAADKRKPSELPPLSAKDMEEISDNIASIRADVARELSKTRPNAEQPPPQEERGSAATEAIVQQALEEQRQRDIKAVTEQRAIDSFDAYEQSALKRLRVELDDEAFAALVQEGDADDVVEEILASARDASDRELALQEEYTRFLQYEADRRGVYSQADDSEIAAGGQELSDADFDELQLRLMQQLVDKAQAARRDADGRGGDDDDDGERVEVDLYRNIQSGIQEIKQKIDDPTTANRQAVPPDTSSLKAWQMYRAIATKRSNDRDSPDTADTAISSDPDVDLEQDSVEVAKQVDAWKDFQRKEEDMRRATGLSIETRMPFEWHQPPTLIEDAASPYNFTADTDATSPQTASSPENTPQQTRYQMDQMALQVLQDLMQNTADLDRRLKLKQDIESIQLEMEQQQLRLAQDTSLQDDDAAQPYAEPPQPIQPSTITSIFKSSSTDKDDTSDVFTYQNTKPQPSIQQPTIPTSEQQLHQKNENAEETLTDTNDAEEALTGTNDADQAPKLGSFQEQKFRSIVAESGIRTDTEENNLRDNWEEFQKAEQKMRALSELSSTELTTNSYESIADNEQSYLKFKEYEDQAKKAAIPNNEYDEGNDSNTTGQSLPQTETNNSSKAKDDIFIRNKQATQWGRSSYSDQVYRSVGAANRAKEQDEDQKLKSKAAFEELLQQQDENRRLIENITTTTDANDADIDIKGIDDIDTYAEKALSSLGARPTVPQKEEESKIQSSSSRTDESKNNSASSDAATPPRDTSSKRSMRLKNSSTSSRSRVLQEQMPDWLRREIEESRGEEFSIVDEYTEDDEDMESDEVYLENERQAEEFGNKVLGATKAVDLGKVLGRDVFSSNGSDEYDDLEEQRLSDNFSSFDARKANLLEYTVLSVADINALMEHKPSSSLNNDASLYPSNMNRPSAEFAAIFQLEGVIVDLSGLQSKAWARTAQEYDLKPPTLDDIRYASVHNAEFAIKKIFYWVDDMVICGRIAQTYHKMILTEIKEWMKENSSSILDSQKEPALSATNNLNNSEDIEAANKNSFDSIDPAVLEADLRRLQTESWRMVALEYGFDSPSSHLIEIAGTLDPNESVMVVFGWTSDVSDGMEMASSYRSHLRELTESLPYSKDIRKKTISPSDNPSGDISKSNEEMPSQNSFVTSANDRNGPPIIETKELPESTTIGTSKVDIIKLQHNAWISTAQDLNFPPPTIDDVYAASIIDPKNAIISIFKWSLSEDKIDSAIALYRTNLKTVSAPLINIMKLQENPSPGSSSKDNKDLPFILEREGVTSFLKTMKDMHIPCVVVSYLSSEVQDIILTEMGLTEFFPTDRRVSYSSGYELDMHQLLGGALRAEKRPDECLFFSSTPQSAAYAHDVEMKNIAMVIPYPYYELRTSDITVRDFETIRISNMKNMFRDKRRDEPMQQLQLDGPEEKIRRLTKTKFWDDV